MGCPKGNIHRILRGIKALNTRKNLFFSNVSIPQSENGCMVWIKSTRSGYGRFRVNNKNVSVHRFSYELFVGKIPEGKIVLHICDNRSCIRPDHLRVGTSKDNAQDTVAKNRHNTLRGEKGGNSILKDNQAIEIKKRLKQGESCKKLAEEYKMHITTISKINTGVLWRHIPWL